MSGGRHDGYESEILNSVSVLTVFVQHVVYPLLEHGNAARQREAIDGLTAQLAVLAVAQMHESSNAHAIMEFIWRVLESARSTFGGNSERNNFFKLVGKRVAGLFDGIVKKHGLAAISADGRITDLLFSLTTPGTQDRTALEEAYFEETKTLQK